MTKVLVLYYSAHGHIEALAYAAAEGARTAGAEAVVKRVPETTPDEIAQKYGFKLDQKAPIATVEELAGYDGILLGFPTRFGMMPAQMKAFLDQTGGLWYERKLVGKVGSIFTSSGSQHGGQESTILGSIPLLLHHGMIVVGLPYTAQGQLRLDEITGGSPYGASTIAAPDRSRQPSANELELASSQGKFVAETARKQAAA